MKTDFLRQGPLPIRLFSTVGIIATGLAGVFQVVDWVKAPYDRQRAEAQALWQKFNEKHTVDWSRVDQVSYAVFQRFEEAPASDSSKASWQASLVTSFEQDARQEFIHLAGFFEVVLSCVKAERCDEGDALGYFENRICIFWNKTWPYFEHLDERSVVFSSEVRSFVDQRNCREVELEARATGRAAVVPAV
jgi:hypothetical protein